MVGNKFGHFISIIKWVFNGHVRFLGFFNQYICLQHSICLPNVRNQAPVMSGGKMLFPYPLQVFDLNILLEKNRAMYVRACH